MPRNIQQEGAGWMQNAYIDLFAQQSPAPAAAAKPSTASAVALPNGRQRNIRLKDIMEIYKSTARHFSKYSIVDFRPPKIKDVFLTTGFEICRSTKNYPSTHPRFILKETEAL